MASTSPSETTPSPPEGRRAQAHAESPRHWLLSRLDWFLSEPLRATVSASELVRYRVMIGASLFLFVSCVLYVLTAPPTPTLISASVSGLGYLGTLVLLRRSSSSTAPAWLLCMVLTQGLIVSIFLDDGPLAGAHAATMVLPALAVYLMGLRPGFVLTGVLMVALGLLRPLHYTSTHAPPFVVGDEQVWLLHFTAAISFLGAWGLGALHSTARDAAQSSLERALKVQGESENKLLSLIESTDDMICSMDLQGRLVAINAAQKRLFRKRVGQEPQVGEIFFSRSSPERQELWRQRFAEAATGQPARIEEEYELDGEHLTLDIRLNPIFDKEGHVTGLTLYSRDISARKAAEARLGEMHRTLVDVSRQAGMAEIATGVLHNVGNTLNSVNVSTSVLAELLRKSRIAGLAKAAQLLREHTADVATFFTQDPQGQKLPSYLIALAENLVEEREALSREVLALTESVDHIKSIVSMQQKHARTAGAIEEVQVPQLIDEALRLHAISLERLGIRVEREYATVPSIPLDRHKLLQILINLLSNARHALVESQQQDKRLVIRVRPAAGFQHLLIEVADNGMGIAPENMARIFTQGFTTKKTGHGFGLHISALAATEMKGRLTCASPGPGQGATFTLELPMAGEEALQ